MNNRVVKFTRLFAFVASLTLTVWFFTVQRAESQVLDFIQHQLILQESEDVAFAVNLASVLGKFLEPRRLYNEETFPYSRFSNEVLNSPILTVLMNGGGSCGYSAEVGVALCQKLGYDARFVQLLDSKGDTRHVVFDFRLDSGDLVVVDPIFGTAMIDSMGIPYTYDQLKHNWAKIRLGLPATKIRDYSYEHGVQFTNWQKFGALESTLRRMVRFLGEDDDQISLRVHWNQMIAWLPVFFGGLALFFLVGCFRHE